MTGRSIVITGLGVISPLGNAVKELWKALLAGRSGTGPVTSFDASPFPSRIAAEVRDFDPKCWLNPKTLRRSGRAAQFSLAASAMALEDAGWTSGGKVAVAEAAVIMGSGYGAMSSVEEAYRVFYTEGWKRNPFLSVPMCMPNAPGSQVALEFRLRGPSYSVTAACASGAQAIGDAVHLMRSGAIDRALVGGVDATILPGVFSIWCLLGVMSERNADPAGACAPFSADRDGLVIGEGACVMTLERREDAERRGVHIYAEVAGVGSNCGADNITAPTLEGEVSAMQLALRQGGIDREEIGYINAHGTATKLNDPLETRAIRAVFGEHARRVAVSSTKSMIGHTMGASSAIECAVAALALRDQAIPPTINLRVPDPDCDLDYVTEGARTGSFRAALSNSFAFGGSNVILALRRHEG